MKQPSIFVNQWNKSAENANIGMSTLVGVETYSKKGIAQLTKDTTVGIVGGEQNWTGLVKYIVNNNSANSIAAMSYAISNTETNFYNSLDLGVTWSLISVIAAKPWGLIFFQSYYLAFAGSSLWYSTDLSSWTEWKTLLFGLGETTPFISPNDGFIYFGNGNKVGKMGFGSNPTFNPAGSSGTDYYFNPAQLPLPDFYQVTCISFLPVNYIALGTSSISNPQVSDIILWNPTLSTYETPLRLFSRAQYTSASNDGGIKQIINRNNTLYAVTGGNHAIYETNGTNFSLVTDITLRSNIRKPAGTENNISVFMKEYPMAIAVLGNKILTGISTPTTPAYPTGYGLFPCGVWTVAFSDGGGIGEISYGINGNSVQCEFPISTNTLVATTPPFEIGCIFPLGNNRALISWSDATSGLGAPYGIDYIETNNYQNNASSVVIESEMIEVGTNLNPVTIGNLQFNLVRNLMVGQTISLYYRTAFDQDFTAISSPDLTNGTITGNGTQNTYSITVQQIGATRYIQFQIHMATVPSGTSSTIATYTPQLRDFIIGNPSSTK